MPSIQEKFVAALVENQADFRVDLNEEKHLTLGVYFELVQTWNKRLHLVAPCSPEEFAVRHILESLVLLEHLPENAKLVDLGAGAGLPSIPCLISREDLHGTLVESSPKKVIFLREAAAKLGLQNRVTCLNMRFEDVPPPEGAFIACRALDKFVEKLPEIISWAQKAEKLLLFGGEKIRDELNRLGLKFNEMLIPVSEQRFVFEVSTKLEAAAAENDFQKK